MYVLYSINLIPKYYIFHGFIVTWPTSISYIASLPFTNPLLWPHATVMCPSYAHFRISTKVVSHMGTFHLLCIWTYYSFHIQFLTYYIVGKNVVFECSLWLLVFKQRLHRRKAIRNWFAVCPKLVWIQWGSAKGFSLYLRTNQCACAFSCHSFVPQTNTSVSALKFIKLYERIWKGVCDLPKRSHDQHGLCVFTRSSVTSVGN